MQYCFFQHRTLLLSPVTSTTGWCFCFGSIPSSFLELFLHWSPVAYWAPIDLGSSSFSILSFCLFILFMGFSRQEYWSGLSFPSPVDHNVSDLSTMTPPFWVAPRAWLSFIELDKAVVLVWLDWLVSCEYGFSVSALWCPLATLTVLLQLLSHVQVFATPWTAACQASLSITNSQSCSNACPSRQWCHPTISSSVVPFSSCLQSFTASGSFTMSQFFASGGQSIRASASASVLPVNIQDWFLLGWTGCISLQSKVLSRVFSSTTVQKHQFFGAQLSLYPNSHIHTWLLERP